MDVYRIFLTGDDDRVGTMSLTDEEISIFKKIVGKLEPLGPYAPGIIIENLSNQEKRQKETERRKAEEQRRKAEEDHKKEVADKWKAAFVAAGWEF